MAEDWTRTYQDPDELLAAFGGRPEARYRPLAAWWWSGEPVTEERMLWQLDRIVELGCGGLDITGVGLHGPAAGSVADDPLGLTPEWVRLKRLAMTSARNKGLGVATWNPLQFGMPRDVPAVLAADPGLRGELVRVTDEGVDVQPFGLDYGNPATFEAHLAPGTASAGFLDAFEDLYGDAVIGLFEDEWPAFPRWAPGMQEELTEILGEPFPLEVFERDVGPRTPALRVAMFEHAVTRIERGYTAWMRAFVDRHGLLAGYDQNNRTGSPIMSSAYYLDPFRTLAWANAPGADQNGDARFHLSLADLTGASRVWLEGFHSLGWGLSLSDQMRLLWTWAREGVSLFLPHGMYYAQKALWWEYASPEIGWKQPYARHYPAFADAVGRLMAFSSAGRHVPEVAVLYPLTTVWADTTGHLTWGEHALRAEETYLALFGLQDVPSGWDLERPRTRSLLADAGYDRVAVDEAHVDHFDLPVVVPSCLVLRTETVHRLIALARRKAVVLVEPVPAWSAEVGREDPAFTALVAELCTVATVVSTPAAVLAALPAARVQGALSQWRRAGDLDLLLLTGTGEVRLRGCADRSPHRWDERSGSITPYPAVADGEDLLVTLTEPATLLSLPPGDPVSPQPALSRTLLLPEVWDVSYAPWGENRWGDYRLPASPGTPPVERRTFAFREGDDPGWQCAPVTPEDVQQPVFDLAFQQRMAGDMGRVPPADRLLPDGWREVVATYGPRLSVDGELREYSERLGVEDLIIDTPLGLKGYVEPVKADLGSGGSGQVRSWCHLVDAVQTHLVLQGSGVVSVSLDGVQLTGPTELGVLVIPVNTTAGWHELVVDVRARTPNASVLADYRPEPRTRLGWALRSPYALAPRGIWGGPVVHPDYKGSPGPHRFRRHVEVSEIVTVTSSFTASGVVTADLPSHLEPGRHLLVVGVGRGLAAHHLTGTITLAGRSGTSVLGTDERWEIEIDGAWIGAFPVAGGGAVSFGGAADLEEEHRRTLFTDVAWLEGDGSSVGMAVQTWAESADQPPPAWFAFTAPPGARSMTLPVVGNVSAWVNGTPAPVVEGALELREHARVALRVQAPAGRRGAACFTEHPVLTLGDGTLCVGASWHRQGLDCFSGVLVHRTALAVLDDVEAVLDLGDVRGSVRVRLDGRDVTVLFAPPWTARLSLTAGTHVLELEVANTLGPMAGRGVPTPFGPEDQRFSGLLRRPVLHLP